MVSMMEKHANHLESLVEERTTQLEEEKKKTDRLLYQLLPPYVNVLLFNCLLIISGIIYDNLKW